jgi:hypothetical protein
VFDARMTDWRRIAALAVALGASSGTAGAAPVQLVCQKDGAPTAVAARYANALCAAVADGLAARAGTTVQRAPPARMKPAAPGRWALLSVTVSSAHSAKARLSLGTAAELLSGQGRRTPEFGSRVSDAELNATAAAGLAKALVESLAK